MNICELCNLGVHSFINAKTSLGEDNNGSTCEKQAAQSSLFRSRRAGCHRSLLRLHKPVAISIGLTQLTCQKLDQGGQDEDEVMTMIMMIRMMMMIIMMMMKMMITVTMMMSLATFGRLLCHAAAKRWFDASAAELLEGY